MPNGDSERVLTQPPQPARGPLLATASAVYRPLSPRASELPETARPATYGRRASTEKHQGSMDEMSESAAAAVTPDDNAQRRRPLVKRRLITYALDALLIFILTGVLIKPLFKVKYSDKWGSISTFIADARFLKDHWPHPGWQPLWYTGTRFDYVYPPALRYGSAALARWFPILPVRGYHIYIGLNYCIGIVGVYLLVRILSRSRGAGWLAAAATALVSPSFLFLPNIRADAWLWQPQRLGVLVKYGEGPHMSALAWLPIALAFSWRAVERWRPLDLVAAAVASAVVVSHNFYGATALAMLFPMLVWSLYITHVDMRMWLRAAAIAIFAYGLTAFWLVPSYFAITLRNMKHVSEPGNTWSLWVGVAVAIAFVLLSDRYGRNRRERAYAVFLAGIGVLFVVNVLGNQYFGFRIIGEPGRLIPELDLALILIAVELIRRLWISRSHPRIAHAVAAIVVVVSLGTSYRYVLRAWHVYPPDLWYEKRVEYELPHWMAANLPNSRAVVAGSIRFWYDTWHDLAQLGGGSEQGMLSDAATAPLWEIAQGQDGQLAKMWMQILGVDAIIVNGRKSEEHYHDFAHPEKFKNLPVLHDNGRDDVIYAVPRRYPSLARVVESPRLEALQPIDNSGSVAALTPYYEALEQGPDAPTQTRWEGSDVLHVKARVTSPGQSIFIQVAYDTPWRAWSGGSELPVRQGPLRFMRIDAPPGDHDIRLQFTTPVENIVGRVLTVLTLCAGVWLAAIGLRSREARL
jgi:hypothetical protein